MPAMGGSNLYQRGHAFASDSGVAGSVGMEKLFANTDPSDTQQRRNQDYVRMKLVKNNSGGNLNAGECVKYKAGAFQTEIGGACGAGDIVDGVVDDLLDTVVANGEYCWICVEGEHQVIASGSSAAEGDFLITAASGKVALQDTTPANVATAVAENQSLVGRALEAEAADGVKFLAYVKPYGH